MTRVVERATVVGFGACLVLLGTVSAAGWLLASTSYETAETLDHEGRILASFQRILVDTTSIESGQRGYVITGDEAYLAPYEEAVSQVDGALGELEGLARGDATDGALAAQLAPLVRRRVELARQIVEARRHAGPEAAHAIIQRGEPLVLMTQIRALVRDARRIQEQEIAAQDALQEAAATQMIVVGIVGLVLCACVGAAAYLAIRRHARSLVAAERVSRRLAEIVESSDDAIISKDLDGTIMTWNQAAERLYGYLADEIVGSSIAVLVPAERRAEMNLILERMRRGERLDHFDTVRLRKDGSRVHVSLTASPIRDRDGSVTGVSIIVRDIGDRKAAEFERERLIAGLQDALGQVKTLRGMLPMCAWCKSIRDDRGYWNQVEAYIARHSDAEFTHGICPSCLASAREDAGMPVAHPAR